MTPTRNSTRRSLLLAATTAAAAALVPWGAAHAQAYPNKPVNLIVPWPAGGSTDRHLRALSEL
ncbi:MAG: tripartite tricarboxylate transporter substrate binding protein, partial [Ramlibacter sp.]|nr:tripartite tricarboxylate transporter substrate binding protein [Ramlibacter sp.]